jgi:hypothetical protein
MVTTNKPCLLTTPITVKRSSGSESPLFESETMDEDMDELTHSPLAFAAPMARMYRERRATSGIDGGQEFFCESVGAEEAKE